MKRILITLIVLFSFQLSHGQITKNGNPKAIDQILVNVASFSKYVMAGDVEKITASYTEGAKIFPNRSKILSGESIANYWTPRAGYTTTHHKISPEEITIIGNTAYDYGYYEGATKNPNGQTSKWAGKYVIVWKKVGNDWKMYLDIWNSID